MHTPPFINMRVVVDDSDVRLSLWWWGGQLGVCRCLALFEGGLHMEVQMGGSCVIYVCVGVRHGVWGSALNCGQRGESGASVRVLLSL
jgi:hypothetical protein